MKFYKINRNQYELFPSQFKKEICSTLENIEWFVYDFYKYVDNYGCAIYKENESYYYINLDSLFDLFLETKYITSEEHFLYKL